jgi:hypothetical protein
MYPLGAFRWEFAQRPQIFPVNRRSEFFNRIDPKRPYADNYTGPKIPVMRSMRARPIMNVA